MSHCRSTEPRLLSPGGGTITRRALVLALALAPLAACGKKGGLELPPPEPFEEGPNPLENPETYGDPMTFPEPGEEEASPDPGDEESPE
jgi:predicted small lipoprotein YifL